MCAGGGSLPLRSQAAACPLPPQRAQTPPATPAWERRQRRFFPRCPKERESVFLRWYFDCGENNTGRNVGIEKNNTKYNCLKRGRVLQFAFQKFAFSLSFLEPVFADTNPLFILRSMMKKNLRSMCLPPQTQKRSRLTKIRGGVELRTFF